MKRFVVSKSTIPGAGKGLFAVTNLPMGTKIPYTGDHLATDSHTDHTYCFRLDEKTCLYATTCLARYVNDTYNTTFHTNMRWRITNDRVYLETTRRIKSGEELFIRYGSEYWSSREKKDQ